MLNLSIITRLYAVIVIICITHAQTEERYIGPLDLSDVSQWISTFTTGGAYTDCPNGGSCMEIARTGAAVRTFSTVNYNAIRLIVDVYSEGMGTAEGCSVDYTTGDVSGWQRLAVEWVDTLNLEVVFPDDSTVNNRDDFMIRFTNLGISAGADTCYYDDLEFWGIRISTDSPTNIPTNNPTKNPTKIPTSNPSENPTQIPTKIPTLNPTELPTKNPTETPTTNPSQNPSTNPTETPTNNPSETPTNIPTITPTLIPTLAPSVPADQNVDDSSTTEYIRHTSDNEEGNITDNEGEVITMHHIILYIVIGVLFYIILIGTILHCRKKQIYKQQIATLENELTSATSNHKSNVTATNKNVYSSLDSTSPRIDINTIGNMMNTQNVNLPALPIVMLDEGNQHPAIAEQYDDEEDEEDEEDDGLYTRQKTDMGHMANATPGNGLY